MLRGRQFKKGDLVGVTGYLKEWHWTDSQGQNHRVNELVVTGITKHLPKGLSKPQPQQLEMPVAEEAEPPKRKPRKGIIRVGVTV